MSSRDQGQQAANFNLAACPIIVRHWLGVEPLHPVGQIAAEVVADLTFRRKVERLHRLGPRVVGELLAELGVERSIMPTIHEKLERYANINPQTLRAVGGDDFWPAPLHEVRRAP